MLVCFIIVRVHVLFPQRLWLEGFWKKYANGTDLTLVRLVAVAALIALAALVVILLSKF